jgi:hypothetical protein
MKKLLPVLAALSLVAYSCSLPNKCELSEKFSPSWTRFVSDRGYNKYQFNVSFDQVVEVYTGDCDHEKYKNETNLKITSKAPCDQVINVTIKVDLGDDSYEFIRNNVPIQSDETIDFGVIWQNGPRIDFADIDIAIFCPLCPGDEP